MRYVLFTAAAALRHELSTSAGFVLSVLAGLAVCGALALAGRRWAAVALVPLAVAWLLCNGEIEGPTILALSWNHGVTVADLVSFAALGLAGWRLLPPAGLSQP